MKKIKPTNKDKAKFLLDQYKETIYNQCVNQLCVDENLLEDREEFIRLKILKLIKD